MNHRKRAKYRAVRENVRFSDHFDIRFLYLSSSLLEKKLDDQSLEILFQTIRSNETLNQYSNEELVDAIIRNG